MFHNPITIIESESLSISQSHESQHITCIVRTSMRSSYQLRAGNNANRFTDERLKNTSTGLESEFVTKGQLHPPVESRMKL